MNITIRLTKVEYEILRELQICINLEQNLIIKQPAGAVVHNIDAYTWEPLAGFDYYPHVKGWLNPAVLRFTKYFVDRFLIGDFDSLEIGVHQGKFFLGIENLTPVAGRCIAADVFSMQELNIDDSGRGNKEIFDSNVKEWAVAPQRVIALEVDSLDISPIELGINKFGIISIDGGHTRSHTFNDLKIAQDLITSNGLIVLDDILNQDWCGVITGALDFFNSGSATRIVPIAIGFNKLFIAHFSVADARKRQIIEDKDVLSRIDITPRKLTPFGGNQIISLVDKNWREAHL